MKTVKQTLIDLYLGSQTGTLGEAVALTIMQEKYPGEYTIRTKYDTRRMCFGYKPVFEDPKKEMLWRIKYGY